MNYKVTVPKIVRYITDPDPRVTWCHDNVGGHKKWTATGWPTVTFSFKDESDAVLFSLRWIGREN